MVLYSFENGGSERLGGWLALQLHDEGWPIEVCATHSADGPVRTWLEQAGIPAVGIDIESRSRIDRRWQIHWLMRSRRIELMHVQHVPMLALCYWPARLAGVGRIVVTEHTDEQMRSSARVASMGRRYGRRADLATVVHEGLRRYMVGELGVPPSRVRTIPNGVDTARFRPAAVDAGVRAELGAGPDDLLLGTVARLHPDKDHATLLHAFARLRADAPSLPVRLALVGDGPERAPLERLARELEITERVCFAGDREDVARIVPQLDAFVLSSCTEGVPLVLIEAMASGVPCVSTAVGGIADLLADGAGETVPPREPHALARALAALASDPARRAETGARARRTAVERHDFARVVDDYRQALRGDAVAPGAR